MRFLGFNYPLSFPPQTDMNCSLILSDQDLNDDPGIIQKKKQAFCFLFLFIVKGLSIYRKSRLHKQNVK
jgi:hypothetical protein